MLKQLNQQTAAAKQQNLGVTLPLCQRASCESPSQKRLEWHHSALPSTVVASDP